MADSGPPVPESPLEAAPEDVVEQQTPLLPDEEDASIEPPSDLTDADAVDVWEQEQSVPAGYEEPDPTG